VEDKRAWLWEVQVMQHTLEALKAKLDAVQGSGTGSAAATTSRGDDAGGGEHIAPPLPPQARLPGWAAAALKGQLVETRARFGALAADAAETEAAECLAAAAAVTGDEGDTPPAENGLPPPSGTPRGGAIAADENIVLAALTARDDALRLMESLRSDWEVEAAHLRAQLDAALQRAERAERIVVSHAMDSGSGGTPRRSFGSAAVPSDAAITAAAMHS
jgi:hypothetical protein